MSGHPAIGRLAGAARRSGLDLAPLELAEIIWLAAHMPTSSRDDEGSHQQPPPSETPPVSPRPDPSAATAAPQLPSTEIAEFHRPPLRGETTGRLGVLARSPGTAALPTQLALARSLRPLKRRMPSQTSRVLDERATARIAAETGLWIPIFRPRPDRWFDVGIVADQSSSMVTWGPTIAELRDTFLETGAFRDVRVWRIDTSGGPRPLSLRGETSTAMTGRHPRELIDPAGRRLIVVVSDCVGEAWYDGRVLKALAEWGRRGPVAIIQPLPQRMWKDTAITVLPVELRAFEPGAANRMLRMRPQPDHHGVPVPVLELEPRWLARWSRLVAQPHTGWFTGAATDTGLPPSQPPSPGEEPLTAADMVNRFQARTSPEAYRLAAYLSAAPLSLPVMRLVQHVVSPQPRPSHLAEVFLSGLIRQVSPDSVTPAAHPDEVQYDFEPGVRELLLTRLSKREALRVLAEVSEFVRDRLGIPVDFLAMLTTGELLGPLDSRSLPFAQVAADILRALGGSYADKADKLRDLVETARRHRHSGTEPVYAVRHPQPVGDDVTTSGSGMQTSNGEQRRQSSQPVIMRGVPARNPGFVGRTALLNQLHAMMSASERSTVILPQSLHGLGGVGKTQLAIEYAHRYSDQYDLVWWIPAEDPAEVRRSMVELANYLKLPLSTDTSQTILRVIEALKAGQPFRRWLLVFDNAAAPETLEQYLPDRTGEVLITSRDQAWATASQALEVDVFERPESIAMLGQRASAVPREQADLLADIAGDLPLALELAAAWHQATRQPTPAYVELFEAQLQRLGTVDLPPGYPLPVAAAWGVAFSALSDQSLPASQLLQLSAYFGAEPISVDLFWRGRYAPELPSPLDGVLRDRVSLRRALRDIGKFGLARYDSARENFQVHRLVQAIIRTDMSLAQQDQTRHCAQRVLVLANPGSPDELDPREVERHAELWPHIVPSDMINSSDVEARRVILDQVRYRYLIGDYESARELAQNAVNAWDPGDELTLLTRRQLANTLRSLGLTAEAYELDHEILRLFQQTYGPNHDFTLLASNSVSADLRAMGQFRQARAIDEPNLAKHIEIYGEEDPATLRTANNLAVDMRLMGDFGQALELDEKTVERRTRLFGPEHPTTLYAVSQVVRDLYGLGRYREALRLGERILPTHEEVLGAGHPEVLLTRRVMGVTYRKLGRYVRARELAETNVAAYRNRFGPAHEHSLAAIVSLANALREDGALQLAKERAEEALHNYERHFSDQHPFKLACLVDLAIVQRRLGNVTEAITTNEDALERLRRTLGDDHPYTVCCMANLASDYAATGDYPRARAMSEVVLEKSVRVRGDDHPYTLACASNLAIDLIAVGEQARGTAMSEDTVRRLENLLGADHPDVAAVRDQRRLENDIEPPPT